MKSGTWERNILDVIKRISDRAYQERTWFGSTEIISSPEELYCELFDDYTYDDFLESPSIHLTQRQRNLGIQLKEKLNSYSKTIDELPDPKKVFNDTAWDEIRKLAKQFLDSFSSKRQRMAQK